MFFAHYLVGCRVVGEVAEEGGYNEIPEPVSCIDWEFFHIMRFLKTASAAVTSTTVGGHST